LKKRFKEMVELLSTDPGLKLHPNDNIDIEVHTFNARMRFDAEKHYFDEEAAPDWRCKARILDSRLSDPTLTRGLMELRLPATVDTWWAVLKALTNTCFEESRELNTADQLLA
jgi:hypothetical protein